MTVALEDYRWLVSAAAEPWLVLGAKACSRKLEALVPRLRKELSAERAHLAVEQIELRERGREKFSAAARMFFTRKGLEQATDEALAAYKASRFATGQEFVDLCCGIGGDLLALAGRGRALGIDRDPVAALLAEANAAALGLARDRCRVSVENATSFARLLNAAAWHCDPDRRAEGRRVTQGEAFEPPLNAVEAMLGQNPQGAIKLAPATVAPDTWREQAEREWLGSRGECRQQVAWFGSLARHPGMAAATVVSADGRLRTVVGSGDEPIPIAAAIGRFVYEPQAAILAARLTGAICAEHSLAALAPGVAYLTADTPAASGDDALAAFEICDVLPLDQKQLKTYCRERQIGRLEVKKRGVQIDPEKLRKAVIGVGDEEATLIVSPVGSQKRVLVARRPPLPARASHSAVS